MNGIASSRLLEKIHQTVVEIPRAVLEVLIRTLQNAAEPDHEQIKQAVLKQIPTQEFRITISELLETWRTYDISAIVTEMERAITRGVALTIVVETPESSQGKISFGADASFTDLIKTKACILKWPYEKRERDESGKYGSLHAKCAVMDRESVLISSANLTQYALNLNMELGLLVKDNNLAEKIVRHFETLKLIGVLRTRLDRERAER